MVEHVRYAQGIAVKYCRRYGVFRDDLIEDAKQEALVGLVKASNWAKKKNIPLVRLGVVRCAIASLKNWRARVYWRHRALFTATVLNHDPNKEVHASDFDYSELENQLDYFKLRVIARDVLTIGQFKACFEDEDSSKRQLKMLGINRLKEYAYE